MTTKAIYIRRRITLLILFLLLIWGAVIGIRAGIHKAQNYIKFSRIKVIKGQIRPGQVLFTSLLEHVSREAANEILVSIDNILNLQKLQAKEKYKIYLNPEGQIEKFVYEKSPIDQYFSVRDEDGDLKAFKPLIYLDKETISKEFIIKTSLLDAMHKKGEEDTLVFSFVDIFAWDIDFYLYPRAGDKIKIYFEKYYKEGKFVKYGRILAAQYKSPGRETFNAVYFEPKNDKAGYYSLNGNPTAKMFLKSPLKFTGRITSYFGYRRDPFTSRHSGHRGVDFAAYYGAPIVATSSGTVSFTGWKGAYGKLVIVGHPNGYSTYYGHTSRILVRRGQKVAQGQVIAKVGSTGRSTGPHCHYEIRQRGQAFNPLRFNQPQRKPLKGKDLKEFKKHSKKIWAHIAEER